MIQHTLLAQNFDQFNPLIISSTKKDTFKDPAGFISEVLKYAFPLAGMILFVMILWGGFEMLSGATAKGKDAGKQRITAAVIGFFLLFAAYWLTKLLALVFGVDVPLG